MKKLLFLALAWLALLLSAHSAFAGWNAEWPKRVKVSLNTAADGLPVAAPVDAVPLLVRLHTGNFPFIDAKSDGADLRFIAADDKTPLKFHIEKFDGLNELALVWVQLPKLAPGMKSDFVWIYYGNQNAVPAGDSKTSFDAAQVLVYHFSDKVGAPQDATAAANHAASSTAKPSASSLIGAGASFDGAAEIKLNASPSLKSGAGGLTLSMWLKPVELTDATLAAMGTALSLQIKGGKLLAQAGSVTAAAAQPLLPSVWQHVAVVAGTGLTLYLNGQEVGKSAAGGSAAIDGALSIGRGYKGELDEFAVASTARSADWLKVAAASQGESQKLVTYGQAEGGAEDGGVSYMKVLLGAVTIDGWVVIAILALMFVISLWVMVSKAVFLSRAAAANEGFKKQFEKLIGAIQPKSTPEADDERVDKAAARKFRHSSLYRLYSAGLHELRGRFEAYSLAGREPLLSAASLNAIRATVDARMVRETQRLNSKMVLLTISIAGGPFLGLLGTVVGVMITFAAIAAAGDVNVNSIAPGIAAALVATVAGLAVAIPSLFAYNYFTGRIQAIAADMQVFVDELITRFAENHAA